MSLNPTKIKDQKFKIHLSLIWQKIQKTLLVCQFCSLFCNHIGMSAILCYIPYITIILVATVTLSFSLYSLCILQVDQLNIPTVKDMRHVDRKLKHCWDPSSHDEQALSFLSFFVPASSMVYYNLSCSFLRSTHLYRHNKKKEKKSKHKSKRTSADAQL